MISIYEFAFIFITTIALIIDDMLKTQRSFAIMYSIEISKKNVNEYENKTEYFKEMANSEYRNKAGRDSEMNGLSTLQVFLAEMLIFSIF